MRILFLISVLLFSNLGLSQLTPQNGVAPSKSKVTALKNARIVISPDKIIDNGILLIEGNEIVDAGRLVNIPDNALIIDCEGLTILPAFIETHSSVGIPKNEKGEFLFRKEGQENATHWNTAVHPEISAADLYSIDSKANDELVKMGFGYALTHVNDGIFQGTGAFVSLGNENPNKQIIRPSAGQFISFEKGSAKESYPSSQMGSIALVRQTFYDSKWYTKGEACESNLSLAAMKQNSELPIIFQTKDKWEIMRSEKIAGEFNYRFNYLGSGNEYLAISKLKFVTGHVILPINFPEAYDVKDPYVTKQIPLSDLKHWELAPSNPFILRQNAVNICITAIGQKNAEGFWKNIKKAVERGLSVNEAIAALTTAPATMLGLDKELGTLEKGKLASFTIYSADPFSEDAKLLESWLLGERRIFDTKPKHDISGKYNILLDGIRYPMEITKSDDKFNAKITTIKQQKPTEDLAIHSKDTLYPKVDLKLTGNDITLQFNIDDDNWKGSINLHGKVNSKLGVFEGDGSLPNGKWIQWTAIRKAAVDEKKNEDKPLIVDTSYLSKIWYPNMAFGNSAIPVSETIVFKDVTVWTNETEGVLSDATVITQHGKILFVGTGTTSYPSDAKVIEGKGLHLTSGIIDEHSHIAISRGVNEGGQAISAEVRIGDVINPEDINIYRQLSGGVTAAQLLHGSANPIGGQSALIKLKWGSMPEEMLITNAPKFIKCALGENVKQSNYGDGSRFPQSRMGVEQIFYDGFKRAQNYQSKWEDFKTKGGTEPRKDLELETLSEILRSERFITCHSYVQSEINMLMHVADSMNFKINTFTHILEGYKVADKMKEHGVGASTFSDWWAYKFEVNDAIPYNAAMMNELGLVVAINSDDAEMGRRLNQEAAKSVKYGGMSEQDAWKMVTLNPAKLLHLDDRMGSIKVGKDADLVLWSTNPLSVEAQVKMTLVDGAVLYDQSKNVLLESRNNQEKARIVSKMLESNQKGEESKPFVKKKARHFHCDTLGEEGTEEENTH